MDTTQKIAHASELGATRAQLTITAARGLVYYTDDDYTSDISQEDSDVIDALSDDDALSGSMASAYMCAYNETLDAHIRRLDDGSPYDMGYATAQHMIGEGDGRPLTEMESTDGIYDEDYNWLAREYGMVPGWMARDYRDGFNARVSEQDE